MRAIFRHEVDSYFSSLSGYVFGAFILFFAGIYTMVYNLIQAVTNFEYVLSGISFVFLIIVPILTMRIIAEERKQKTDQLLYSLPISMTKVVLGKFLALLVLFGVPLCIVALYPIILKSFGNVRLLSAYGAFIGFFFLGAALLSIGMFLSSITDNPIVAAGISFMAMLTIYFLPGLASFTSSSALGSFIALSIVALIASIFIWRFVKSSFTGITVFLILQAVLSLLYAFKKEVYDGLFPNIMNGLSLFERFYSFIDGIFDLTSIVYFLSIIGIFLFLTVQSLEKRRWS